MVVARSSYSIWLCCCLFAVLFVVSGSVTQCVAAAPNTQAKQQSVEKSDYRAGYRLIKLQYQSEQKQQITRQVALWYPTTEKNYQINYQQLKQGAESPAKMATGPHALLLFSHGQFSAPEFSSFLIEELAEAGYIVAAVHHQDAVTEWKNHKPTLPDFLRPNNWDETKHKDRPDDLRAALDDLLMQNRQPKSFLHKKIDIKRIGAIGHSMGGYTVCGLIGGWKSWHEKRIRAALMLSPYCMPYTQKQKLDRISVPVMLQGATEDIGITPFLPPLYKQLPKPKYFLVLDQENHFSWTNLVCEGKPTQQAVQAGSPEVIVRYSRAFFDYHLKQDERARKVLTTKDPRLKSFQFENSNAEKD